MNTELAIHYFENRHEIGDRIPGLEERLALDALERVAAGLGAPGWTRREAGWEDTDPSPVTVRGGFPPMPLEWFDRAECHVRHEADLDNYDFNWIAVKRLAGHGARPTTRMIATALRNPTPDATERSVLWSIFESARRRELAAMITHAGASIYEIARAMHLCGAEHARGVDLINQWAARPKPETAREADGASPSRGATRFPGTGDELPLRGADAARTGADIVGSN